MRNDRAGMRPVDLWAGLDMAFKVVGVQLDQPWHQQITHAIQSTLRDRSPLIYCGNHAAFNADRAVDHFVRQNQRGIGKDRLSHHQAFIVLV